jgi:hypothetical protein
MIAAAMPAAASDIMPEDRGRKVLFVAALAVFPN